MEFFPIEAIYLLFLRTAFQELKSSQILNKTSKYVVSSLSYEFLKINMASSDKGFETDSNLSTKRRNELCINSF